MRFVRVDLRFNREDTKAVDSKSFRLKPTTTTTTTSLTTDSNRNRQSRFGWFDFLRHDAQIDPDVTGVVSRPAKLGRSGKTIETCLI